MQQSSSQWVLTDHEFGLFRDLIYSHAGISMTPAKKALISNRLGKRLRHHNIATFKDYHTFISQQANAAELQQTIDLLTTNETYFFREEKHFDFLRNEILNQHDTRHNLRIWSAASSSGQEAYTLAMVLADTRGRDGPWEVLGTDISSQVLERARQGLYPMAEAERIPRNLLNKYCLKGVRTQAGQLLIDKHLRQKVQFKPLNLVGSWPELGQFDVIFLRNVMIYFDQPTKQKLVSRLISLLKPQGHLIIGHSETLQQVNNSMQTLRPSIYRKVN